MERDGSNDSQVSSDSSTGDKGAGAAPTETGSEALREQEKNPTASPSAGFFGKSGFFSKLKRLSRSEETLEEGQGFGEENQSENLTSAQPVSVSASVGSSSEQISERGGIVSARGTSDGLVLRIDGRVEAPALRAAVHDFVSTRSGFLGGQEVDVEWVGGRPEESVERELIRTLETEFKLVVRHARFALIERVTKEKIPTSPSTPEPVSTSKIGAKRSGGLFEGARELAKTAGESFRASTKPSSGGAASKAASMKPPAIGLGVGERGGSLFSGAPVDSLLFDEPDARIVYGTLRSGQKIESEHSVVIIGDVNSGGEVVSGGDIIVLGTLRGVAHAGAYEESGGGRVIFALNLLPTQLRIGSVISRGSAEGGNQPEIARVESSLIVVEPYQSRLFQSRSRK